MSTDNTQNDPAWSYVDQTITAVEKRLKRQLKSEMEDAVLVTAEQLRLQEDGDPDGRLALRVASGEGNRRRIYWRNHQETGMATWSDKQGKVFKKTGQFPLTVRAPRKADGGKVVEVEIAARDMTADELDAWIDRRTVHLAGEAVNLDVFRELRKLWRKTYPKAKTLGAMCDAAGLDLLDLRFTA